MSSLVNINSIPTCMCGVYYKYDKFKDLWVLGASQFKRIIKNK